MNRITFIRPNLAAMRSTDAMPPLVFAILAARTPSGVECRFYDERLEDIPYDETTDLVAITVETFTARRAYQIAAEYRRRGVPVVMGGYHPTLLPEETAAHCDALVIGDAEGSWEQLLADLRGGAMRKQYVGGNTRALDDSVLDRDIFRGKKYTPIELVQYGRGCRFACDFCSIRAFYQDNLRMRTAHSVARELAMLRSRKLVFFVDDNLFGSRELLEALLAAIHPLGIRWCCQISIDVARNEDLLDRMAEAGCMLALIGFESLSPANLKQMAKPWNRVAGDYRSVVRKLHARGIAVYGTFVFGYDDDTPETMDRSLEFALDARLEIANFNPLTPTPGTPLYERLKREDRLFSPQWWLDPNYRYGDPIFTPKSMSAEVFARKCFETKRAFYSWPSIAQRVLGSETGFDWFRTGAIGLANVISRREILSKQHRLLGG